MRRLVFLCLLLTFVVIPVSAMDLAPPEAPDEALELMPADTESFGEGLWEVVKKAVQVLEPELAKAASQCVALIAAVMAISMVQKLTSGRQRAVELVAAVGIGCILLQGTDTLIRLGADTVAQLSDYGKLLLPVMSAGLAAQGGITASAALYGGTVAFNAVLSALVANWLVPLIYIFLAVSIATAATGEDTLHKIRDLIKWSASWVLKILLYIFTGYMSITGVVSGAADAAALKATKLTISGMVPVVGSILSDASEAVLAGAATLKAAAGVYGLIVFAAIWISPFLQIGIQYLLLKATAAVCNSFGNKSVSTLIQNFSSAMGLLLAMTGSVCLLLLISTVCLMKGMS